MTLDYVASNSRRRWLVPILTAVLVWHVTMLLLIVWTMVLQ